MSEKREKIIINPVNTAFNRLIQRKFTRRKESQVLVCYLYLYWVVKVYVECVAGPVGVEVLQVAGQHPPALLQLNPGISLFLVFLDKKNTE